MKKFRGGWKIVKKIANLAFVNFNFRMNFNDKTFVNDDERRRMVCVFSIHFCFEIIYLLGIIAKLAN